MGSPIPPVELDRLRELGVDLICLPEYFFIPDGIRRQVRTASRRQITLDQIAEMSRRLAGVVVGGTLVEEEAGRYYNTSHIFECGRHVGFYRKVFPTFKEREDGIGSGEKFKVFSVRGIRLGVLICSDVLASESFTSLAEHQPDLIAVPTTSPYRANDTVPEKYKRDEDIFVAGARSADAYVLKTCGVGLLMGRRLQGRSLVCAPWGVIARVNPNNEALETSLIAELDLDKLKVLDFSAALKETASGD